MNDFNETENTATNSNSEERTYSMSDYFTSPTPNEAQYREDTPVVTPEIVDAGTDVDLSDSNPVAALAENFQSDLTERELKADETNYTEEEARRTTEELKVKLLHALEAQYDFVQAAEKAFDGHIWVALGYPQGMKGWTMYCADNFAAEKIRVTGQQRTDLITGFTPGKISNRGIAALLGVQPSTVSRAKAKAGIEAPTDGKVRDAQGRLQTIDTDGMSSEDRRKKIVELSEEGHKQTDIAEMVGVTQSTVSDTLRKDKMQRMNDGLEPVALAESDVVDAAPDTPLDLDSGNRESDMQSYVGAVNSQMRELASSADAIARLLESDKWQPGGTAVQEIVEKNTSRFVDAIGSICKILRVVGADDGAALGDKNGANWTDFMESVEDLYNVTDEVLG